MFEINLKNVFNKKVSPLNLPEPQHTMIPDPDKPGKYMGIPFTPQPYPPTSIRPHPPYSHKPLYPPLRPDQNPPKSIPEFPPITRPITYPTLDLIKSNPTDLNKPIEPIRTETGLSAPQKDLGFFKSQVPPEISGPLKLQAMEKIGHIGNWKNPDTPNKVFDIGPEMRSSGSPGSPGSPGALTARKKKAAKSKTKRKVVRKVVKKITKKCKCKK